MNKLKLPLHDATRGGQTFLHSLHMLMQVIGQSFKLCLLVGAFTFISTFYARTTEVERYYAIKWLHAYTMVFLYTENANPIIVKRGDEEKKIAPKIIKVYQPYIDIAIKVRNSLIFSFIIGLMVFLATAFIIMFFISRFGRQESERIRGNDIESPDELKQKIGEQDQGKESGLTIGGIPFPYQQETAHTLLAGSPGTGKSMAMRELLAGVRKNKQRAVVYDVAGDFIKQFYREGKDIILNPLDGRSQGWNIWSDCQKSHDYMATSEALIFEERNNDFFVTAARILFCAIAEKLAGKSLDEKNTKKLVEIIFQYNFENLEEFLKGTDGASIFCKESDKTANSVRAVLSAFTRCLKFCKEAEENKDNFSIKGWVKSDNDDSWVFISSSDEQKALLRPLMTVWLDIVARSIMSLEPNQDRRIFLLIDELPSLNKLPSLTNFLAQSRKYGGCGVLGFQNIAQLEMIWKKEGARAITGLCSTWLIYRCEEGETAEWASKNLYKKEVVEVTENVSYGASNIRDGVNLNLQKKDIVLVKPTEIMNLKNCHGYLRFGRGLPVALVHIVPRDYFLLQDSDEPDSIARLESQNFHTLLPTDISHKKLSKK